MSINQFMFDKAVQALNYLANKENKRMNRMKAIKLLYFADRFHLRKYGRTIFNDKYIAMKYGPVGSGIKDISSLILSDDEIPRVSKVIMLENQYEYKSLVAPDLDVFSDTDIEALEFAYNEFGKLDTFDLAELTHSYPEWKKFQSDLQAGTRARGMDYKDFFDDPVIENDKFAATQMFVDTSRELYSEREESERRLQID